MRAPPRATVPSLVVVSEECIRGVPFEGLETEHERDEKACVLIRSRSSRGSGRALSYDQRVSTPTLSLIAIFPCILLHRR